MSIRSTAKAILYKNGKILLNTHLTENGDIYFDLPGGGQHSYETMEEAVIREVREETGYIIKVDSFVQLPRKYATIQMFVKSIPIIPIAFFTFFLPA